MNSLLTSVSQQIHRILKSCWPFQSNSNDSMVRQSTKKQCVWIARYGLTEFQLEEGIGPFDSDIANPEGIAHAQCLADRLRSQLKCGEIAPTRIYASPFIRATHTAHIVAEKLNLKVYIEDGISEWVTPDLLGKDRYVPRSVFELHYLFPYVSKNYRSVLTTHNMQHLWEDETDLYERSQEIINRLVESAGGQSILICTHAPCAQAVALAMDINANMDPSQSQIPPWPLGGLTMFSRELNTDIGEWSDWTPELMCNTEHMPPGEYRKGAKAWSLPGFVRAKEQ